MIDHPPGQPHVRFDRHGDLDVVRKVGHPDDLRREANALSLLGPTAVEVVDFVELDAHSAELITERILPGDDLRPLARADDDTATRVIAGLIHRIRVEQKSLGTGGRGLPELTDVLNPLRECRDRRLPEYLVDAALSVGEELVESARSMVVHGDLQHRNIARWIVGEESRWRIIDPHGWWGDATFEAVPALVAPESLLLGSDVIDARGIPSEPLVTITRRRMDIIAEMTGDDRERLRSWAFVGAVVAEARMIARYDLVHGAPLALAEGLA